MPATVDAHALEHAHPLPRLEAHLGDMAEIVELRADAGHGTIGDDDPHAGSRSTDRGSCRRLERDFVIEVDFMNAVRKIQETKKLESKLDYSKV